MLRDGLTSVKDEDIFTFYINEFSPFANKSVEHMNNQMLLSLIHSLKTT